MSATGDSFRERLACEDTINRDEIVALMAVDDDLDLWSALYEALGECDDRIEPEPSMQLTCSFMLCYLLRCMRENPPSNHVHSGYEAAWELAACLKHWALNLPESDTVMRQAEREIAREFIGGDEGVRDRLLNGTLEHALESARVCPFFTHWEHDAVLNEAWRLAMDWAMCHGDPTSQ